MNGYDGESTRRETTTRRVVITGAGLISALGTGTEKSWRNLIQGESGAGPITRWPVEGLGTKIAAEVKDFDPSEFVNKREARRMDLFSQYALAATDMAVEESGISIGTGKPYGYEPERVGVIVGASFGGIGSLEEQHRKALKKGFAHVSPSLPILVLANTAPGHIALRYGTKGPNWALVSACATGAHAVGEAFKSIRAGEADAVIAGGADATITPLSIGAFAAMKALSTRNEEPARASRPFDKDRDGYVMGEGAGILVLEELRMAERRGAPILAELAGYGATSDAYHIIAPAPKGDGAARCMRLAFASAKMSPEEVGYITAHGTSTPAGDAHETMAIKSAFGRHAYELAVSSTKSMTGHMMGAAGGAEAVVTVLALACGVLPPTINYETPDPRCDLDYVPNRARAIRVDAAMSNSFGIGGTNATLLFKRFGNGRCL